MKKSTRYTLFKLIIRALGSKTDGRRGERMMEEAMCDYGVLQDKSLSWGKSFQKGKKFNQKKKKKIFNYSNYKLLQSLFFVDSNFLITNRLHCVVVQLSQIFFFIYIIFLYTFFILNVGHVKKKSHIPTALLVPGSWIF